MIWEPFLLALVLGLLVSAGLYFAYLWPSVEPLDEDDELAAGAAPIRAINVPDPAPAPEPSPKPAPSPEPSPEIAPPPPPVIDPPTGDPAKVDPPVESSPAT